MAGLTRGRETSRRMGRRIRLVVVIRMTREAVGGGTREFSVYVTRGTGERRVCPCKSEPSRTVVKTCGVPRGRGVTRLASSRKA
jgi:hypothetical protein